MVIATYVEFKAESIRNVIMEIHSSPYIASTCVHQITSVNGLEPFSKLHAVRYEARYLSGSSA